MNKKIDLLSEQVKLASFLSAAAIAIDDGIAVQNIAYDKLKTRMLKGGQILVMEN